MLRIHSFLQGNYSYIKAASEYLCRACAVVTTGTAVIAVVAFSSDGLGGSKKSCAAAEIAVEAESGFEEKEETEADTEARVYTETEIEIEIEENNQQQTLVEDMCEAQIEEVLEPELVTMAGGISGTGCSVTEYEYDILLHIVAAEAGGCDRKGQILVANVILNRVGDGRFPDTIEEVVFQKNQFSPVLAGTLWSTQVTDSVREAVESALAGEDYSEGALFFSARARLGDESMAWFDNSLRWLFAHDGHEFYTFK